LAEPAAQRVSAERSALCLGCHAVAPARVSAGSPVQVADGVGCESCHGPAEKWLRPHAQGDWAKKSPAEKEALGMPPLHAAADRAAACVVCHVGTADADMNHDLIAAGHPRLNFEYATYLANMPHHWVAKTPTPAAEARAWAVGQVVTARAALDLLAARATPPRPWPEFAEHGCFAWHQELGVRWPPEARVADGRPCSLAPDPS